MQNTTKITKLDTYHMLMEKTDRFFFIMIISIVCIRRLSRF